MVVGYGIKIFWPGLFITSPDHLAVKPKYIFQIARAPGYQDDKLANQTKVPLVPVNQSAVFLFVPNQSDKFGGKALHLSGLFTNKAGKKVDRQPKSLF